jgi:hypothetical protein
LNLARGPAPLDQGGELAHEREPAGLADLAVLGSEGHEAAIAVHVGPGQRLPLPDILIQTEEVSRIVLGLEPDEPLVVSTVRVLDTLYPFVLVQVVHVHT